jgi:cysteine desulfurase/selenocysteine lyase
MSESSGHKQPAAIGMKSKAESGIHYLDHACLGRPSRKTISAVTRAARDVAALNSPGTQRTMKLLEATEQARKRVARFVHTDPANILLIENTTRGLGLIASSLPLESGDSVLMADVEFMGAATVWRRIARRRGVEIVPVRTEGGRVLPEHFAAQANSRTRVIVVSAVQEVSGFRADLAGIQEIATRIGAVLIVDGIQEVGAIPVDLTSHPVDAYCAGGHKWLRSPFGLGFLYVHPRLLDRLDPPFTGYLALQEPEAGWGRYMESPERTPFDPLLECTDARRLETGGIPNWIGAVALDQAIAEFEEIGADRVWARIFRLRERLVKGLANLGLEILAGEPDEKDRNSGIVCFGLPGGVEEDRALLAALSREKVYVSLRYVSGVGGLRVAMHEDNTPEDVDALLAVTARFARRNVVTAKKKREGWK